jgi:transposase InsO family protein
VFRNLIHRRKVSGPNQVWVADITYIRTPQGFLFLGLITDLWSRKIVGHHLGPSLAVEQVLKALRMALRGLQDGQRPIHQSDRRCQYASHAYANRVKQAGLRMSMTEKNHSAENAVAERLNGILKQEYWLDADFADDRQAHQATRRAIHLYNTARPHGALALATPEAVHHVMMMDGTGAEHLRDRKRAKARAPRDHRARCELAGDSWEARCQHDSPAGA